MLLAGALAYYTLLSIVPLLTLLLLVLSRVVSSGALIATLGRYLEWLIPGQSAAMVAELARSIDHQSVIGVVLLITMLASSSLAFTVLENAMAVIFVRRGALRRRRAIVSAFMPYCIIVVLGLGLLFTTLVSGSLQAIGAESVDVFGHRWSLHGVSGALLYVLGILGEVLVLTSIYLVMPVERPLWRHALIGGVTAAGLWEVTRHVLFWYFSTLSQVSKLYGSLTTAIVLLLSLEIAATLLLLGAQVIAEYERLDPDPSGPDLRTEGD